MTFKQERNRVISVIVLVFRIQSAVTLSLSEFYPYGIVHGDRLLPANDDGSSGEVRLSTPFPYFDKNHESLFVNTNGAISFQVEIQQYIPSSFPLGDGRRLIAPFWADVDTTNGGEVWYRESTDQDLLLRATKDVTDIFVGQDRLRAIWLFIATWKNVAFFGANNQGQHKGNTFQTVLITNGRHSYVIFNYNKIEWITGSASEGVLAQAGFNAGDGIRFFSIAGSMTSDVFNLPSTSNVEKLGRWMFRIDEAAIEAGGCNTKGFLAISPTAGTMLGGNNIAFTGPCFNISIDKLVCKFGSIQTQGVVLNGLRGICTVPMMHVIGQIQLNVSIDGGKSFKFTGKYTLLPINQVFHHVNRSQLYKEIIEERDPINITWDHRFLGDRNTRVSIDMVRYVLDQEKGKFHSVYSIARNQLNTGHSPVTVQDGEGEGKQGQRFVTIIRVKRKGKLTNQSLEYQWIWSKLFVWDNFQKANGRCLKWYNKQPNPEIFTSDPSFLPCPRTLAQALADSGRYTADEHCNPKSTDECPLYHVSASFCVRSIRPSNMEAGTQCCYTREGNLLIGPPYSGSLDRVHVHKGIPVISHFLHDIVPYHDCCRMSSNCGKYFKKRPSDNGSRYRPPRPTTGFGDPHLITLDGVEYTFNGYGEYTVLRINTTDFNLQGRMQPLTDNRRTSKATLFTAFAMKENGSDIVEVRLNGRGMIDLLTNGKIIEFDEQKIIEFSGVSVLKYENKAKYLMMFVSGLSVTVEGHRDLLQITLVVPSELKGSTQGLLGYWDDSKEIEFLTSSGRLVNSNATAETIHYRFAESWRVNNTRESLFTYEDGKSFSSYYHPEYRPHFLGDEYLKFSNQSLEIQARAICGNSLRCLFDIRATNKVAIGKATKKAADDYAALVKSIDTQGCVPLSPFLPNGRVRRNDTQQGIKYSFACDKEYTLGGQSEVTCINGTYDNDAPKCIDKGENTLVIVLSILTVIILSVSACVIIFILKRSKERDGKITESNKVSKTAPKGKTGTWRLGKLQKTSNNVNHDIAMRF